jgi:copper transport protein
MLAILAWVAMPAVGAHEPESTGLATRAMIGVFSPVALGSVALLAATGTYAAWRLVGSLDALFSTRYGAALLTKVALLAVTLVLGAINWRRLGPASSTAAGAHRFRRAAGRAVGRCACAPGDGGARGTPEPLRVTTVRTGKGENDGR